MRKLFTTLKSVVAAALVVSMVGVTSCSYDDTDLQNKVNNLGQEVNKVKEDLATLTQRVADLEKKVADEVDALKGLIKNQVVVTSVVEENGGVTVTLSDGNEFTVYPKTVDTDTDTDTYISVKADETTGVYYWAIFNKDGFVEYLTVGVSEERVPVFQEQEDTCEPIDLKFQVNEATGTIEFSVDGGKTWTDSGVEVGACDCEGTVVSTGACIFKNVVVRDHYVTFTLADGSEVVVFLAELIEFEAGRNHFYVLPGEVKTLPFVVNEQVEDISVMNQPMGWKASVEVDEEQSDVVEPAENAYILNIEGPAQELVNMGVADKTGTIQLHITTATGACKVVKVAVDLAELTLTVDAEGNITLENSVAYEQTDGTGNKFFDFADFHIGVVPADVYAQYGDKSFTDTFDDWMWEYTVNVASTKRSTGFGNVIDLQQYQEGVTEKEVYNFSVETLAGAFWPKYTFEYGKEYIIFVSLESEMANYMEHPVLKGAVMDTYKKILIEAEYVADSATWNGASYTLSLAGYQYYVIGWYSDAELNQYIEQGAADSVEALIPMLIQNYGLTSAGAIVSGNFLDQTVTLSSLAESSLTGWAPAITPSTKYHFFVYPFNAATEMELYQHQVVVENLHLFGTFETADLTKGTFDAGITYDVVTMTDNSLNVWAYFGGDVVAYYYAYYSSPADDAATRAEEIIENEMMYDFSWSSYCEASQYKPTYPAYLCIVAVNAAGEYVYVEEEFAPVPLPEVAINSFEYLGRHWEIADDNPETSGGEFVYLAKCDDGNEYKINVYYNYCNADGTIKEGTYNYCTNMPDSMYSSWSGFAIISDTTYDGSKLVVAADKITLTVAGVADYVYVPGSEPAPATGSFTYLGRYWDVYPKPGNSAGCGVYSLKGENYDITLYVNYNDFDYETGKINAGSYWYGFIWDGYNPDECIYNDDQFGFQGTYNGEELTGARYDSTLVVTDTTVTLSICDTNYNVIGTISVGQPTK